MGIHENKATVERFDRLTAVLELDALDEICTPDMINHALASQRRGGLEGTKQFLHECQRDPGKAAWMRAMMCGQQLVTIADGDYVIQFGSRAGSWPGGHFRGFDIPAGEYEYDVAFMYRFKDARIAERWAVRDDLAMIQQLGGNPLGPDHSPPPRATAEAGRQAPGEPATTSASVHAATGEHPEQLESAGVAAERVPLPDRQIQGECR